MRLLFWAVLAFIAAQRVVELLVSRRNQSRLVEAGGRVVEDDGYGLLVAVHVLWFPAMILEHQAAPWAGAWTGTWPLLGVYVLAEALRLWAVTTLGRRWTTRVVVLPDVPLVQGGPYRWMDHPNYVAVVVELAVLPLAFALPVTALLASMVNGVGLRRRIQREQAALDAASP